MAVNVRYGVICFSAFVGEIASTFYIKTVSDSSAFMLAWAFVGPFIGLPFAGFMVESKSWKERIMMAFSMGVGYFLGSLVVYLYAIYEKS